jgi:hypothetical protein
MNKGAKATITIPCAWGYGVTGAGAIPPRATLIFEVELLDFKVELEEENWVLGWPVANQLIVDNSQ